MNYRGCLNTVGVAHLGFAQPGGGGVWKIGTIVYISPDGVVESTGCFHTGRVRTARIFVGGR